MKQLRAQINSAPAHTSQEQHTAIVSSISSSSSLHSAQDFFSASEGGGEIGFGSTIGFGNVGSLAEAKAKPKLGEGAQGKAAVVAGAAAATFHSQNVGDCDGCDRDDCASSAAQSLPSHPLSVNLKDPFADLGKPF